MKTLHIVRHGKSSWDSEEISDIDRSLTEKGIVNSYQMAAKIYSLYGAGDVFYTSPANRALHTALIFSRVMKIPSAQIKIVNDIYEAGAKTLIKVIENTPDVVNSLVIFGHNPGFTDLANCFLSEQIDNLPTSGVVTFKFNSVNWSINNIVPSISEVYFPKK
jgi:phosphohistidine phosphatase